MEIIDANKVLEKLYNEPVSAELKELGVLVCRISKAPNYVDRFKVEFFKGGYRYYFPKEESTRELLENISLDDLNIS